MPPYIKIIFGAVLRHYITAFLAVLVSRHFLDQTDLTGIDASKLSDYLLDALAISVIPAGFAVWFRLKAWLKTKLALALPQFTSYSDVKDLVQDAPLGTRIAAVVTANPQKLL